jgi:hypothetical protein
MVLLAPLFLPHTRLRAAQVVAALVGAVQPTASVDPFRQVGRAMKARVRRAFR